MTIPEYLDQKCGSSYLIWLKWPNRFVMLKNPAFKAFKLICGNTPHKEARSLLSEEFNFTYEFADNLIADVKKISFDYNSEVEGHKTKERSYIPSTGIEFYSSRFYTYLNKTVRIDYGSINFEKMIHPNIRHLENETAGLYDIHYQLFRHENAGVLNKNKKRMEVYLPEESHLLMGEFIYSLANDFLNDIAGEWIMTVHASAVSFGDKAILFTGPSGSGKTTLASILSPYGFKIINDDIILVNHQFRAYSFPYAYSVKTGSMNVLKDIYPEIGKNEEFQSGDKRFRLQTPALPDNGKKIAAIIFVKYNPDATFSFKRMRKTQALAKLLNEVYLVQKSECVKTFMKYICSTDFYRLEYSNPETALETLTNLLEK